MDAFRQYAVTYCNDFMHVFWAHAKQYALEHDLEPVRFIAIVSYVLGGGILSFPVNTCGELDMELLSEAINSVKDDLSETESN